MRIILLKDVKGQGKKDDIIEVSDGYGKNFLIKNKLGVLYTECSKKILDKEINNRKDLEDKLVKEYNVIKEQLEKKVLKFKVKVGKEDKVFGNISTKQISDELKKLGYNIDKKCIKCEENLDTLGMHKVEIELHKRVKFLISVMLEK